MPSRAGVRRQRNSGLALDSFVHRRVGVAKIDVEGHELQVLEGMPGIIERDRPTLLVEVHPGRWDATMERSIGSCARYPAVTVYQSWADLKSSLKLPELIAAGYGHDARLRLSRTLPLDALLLFPERRFLVLCHA